jgi:hypothetical protein
VGRRFFLSVIGVALAASAAVAAFNAWVDPFQHYRKAERFPPRFYNAWQRYVNPGLARHYDYDRIVTGSSLMENVLPRDVDRIMGGRTINLSTSAQTAFDAGRLLGTALRTGKPRHVIMNLDYNAFSGAPDRSGFSEPFPAYMYDEALWNDLPYLLGIGTLRKSVETVAGLRWSRFSTDPARMWEWMQAARFSATKVVEDLDPDRLNERFRQPARTLAGMQASFEANLAPLIAANPRVRFSFVYAPYSILVWLDFEQRGQLEVTLTFREWLVDRMARHPNVEIFDFHAEPSIVLDLDHFTDIYHHSPAVSRAVLQAMHEGRHRLTWATVRANNTWLRSAARSRTPRQVISAALARSAPGKVQ